METETVIREILKHFSTNKYLLRVRNRINTFSDLLTYVTFKVDTSDNPKDGFSPYYKLNSISQVEEIIRAIGLYYEPDIDSTHLDRIIDLEGYTKIYEEDDIVLYVYLKYEEINYDSPQ